MQVVLLGLQRYCPQKSLMQSLKMGNLFGMVTFTTLKINEIPLSISFGKIENIIFADPSLAEEMILDGSISFAVDESGNVNSIQKFGVGVWTVEEILDCSRKAIEIASALREKLNLRQYVPEIE